MKKLLQLTGVSIVAIMTANVANAAGYTCEELIEYTSCNPGYFLNRTFDGDNFTCPSGYTARKNACYHIDNEYWMNASSAQDCLSRGGAWYGDVCVAGSSYDGYIFAPAGSSCPTGYKYYPENGCWDNYAKDILDAEDCAAEEFLWVDQGAGCYNTAGDFATLTIQAGAGGVVCDLCPAGSSCSGGTDAATACYEGEYQPNTGQTSCLTTPAGNYSGFGAVNYTACSVGTYQPQAGSYECLVCPAGSYCGTAGLAAVSGVCAIGEYSSVGASACSSCPETGLIDINGDDVVATTESQGSTSVSACIVGSDVYFKNDIGTYHYKQKCKYGNFGVDLTQSVTNAEECDNIGGSWNSVDMWCDVDVADFLTSKDVCEAWRASLSNEDYRDAITCYEDGGAICSGGAQWYFDEWGLGCDW